MQELRYIALLLTLSCYLFIDGNVPLRALITMPLRKCLQDPDEAIKSPKFDKEEASISRTQLVDGKTIRIFGFFYDCIGEVCCRDKLIGRLDEGRTALTRFEGIIAKYVRDLREAGSASSPV